MRQYEKKDCLEKAVRGQKLGISYSIISIPGSGEVDEVVCFGNNQTNKVVWVPFGSKVSINGEIYRIIKGEKKQGKRYSKTKEYAYLLNRPPRIFEGPYDYSTKCLIDKSKKFHDLAEFISRENEVVYLGKPFF